MVKQSNGEMVEPEAVTEANEEGVFEVVEPTIDEMLNQVEFDLEKMTARQYAEVDKFKNSEAKYFAYLLAHVVTKAPKEWGDITTPDAWNQLPLVGVVTPVFATFISKTEKLPKTLPNIVYNLDDVTPVEFETQKNQLAITRSIYDQARALTKVVKECPELFGGPAILDNWLDAPFYTVFVPARNGYGMAAKDLLANFLRRFGNS